MAGWTSKNVGGCAEEINGRSIHTEGRVASGSYCHQGAQHLQQRTHQVEVEC